MSKLTEKAREIYETAETKAQEIDAPSHTVFMLMGVIATVGLALALTGGIHY